MIKIIIAGGRDYKIEKSTIDTVDRHIKGVENKVKFVTGTAKGADQIPYFYEKLGFPIKEFPADWKRYGRSAGYKRNEEMAIYSDMLIAFWDDKSKGTKNMIDLAKKYGLKIVIVRY